MSDSESKEPRFSLWWPSTRAAQVSVVLLLVMTFLVSVFWQTSTLIQARSASYSYLRMSLWDACQRGVGQHLRLISPLHLGIASIAVLCEYIFITIGRIISRDATVPKNPQDVRSVISLLITVLGFLILFLLLWPPVWNFIRNLI